MKSLFHAYYRLSDEEFESLWENSLIVLDANVLLNIYRYSPSVQEYFFQILDKVKERLWIPYQFASEYHRNRLDVIAEQTTNYCSTDKTLKDIIVNFKSKRSHAVVGDDYIKSLENICDSLNQRIKQYDDLLGSDVLMERIASFFDGRVGNCPTDEILNGLHQEAQNRINKQIPPGYKDHKKQSVNAFGDYVGWAQIIEHSKSVKTNIVLVTDDRKEDWWIEKRRGRSIGPRHELREEFKRETSHTFYMYTPDHFMELAAKSYDIDVNESAIQEVKQFAESADDVFSSKTVVVEDGVKKTTMKSLRDEYSSLSDELKYSNQESLMKIDTDKFTGEE